MHDPIALAEELKRKDQILRETEDQLAAARRLIAELTARREAELIHEAIKRIPAQPPDPDDRVSCGEILYVKPVRDAGSIDTWQEAEA